VQEEQIVWIATLNYVAATFAQYGLMVSRTNDLAKSEHRQRETQRGRLK
jgi:hypothetical protein